MKSHFGFALLLAAVLLAVTASGSLQQGRTYDVATATRGFMLSRASYCPSKNLVHWNCGAACAANPNFIPYAVYDLSLTVGTQAISGIDPVNREIIVVFRGSSNLQNWVADLDFLLVSYPQSFGRCPGNCQVHKGFLASYQSLRAAIREDLDVMLGYFPDYRVLVTGHSLGGSMAEICGLDLAANLRTANGAAPVIHVYSYGALRIGNKALSMWATQLLWSGSQSANPLNRLFRITHAKDPFPHLPPLAFGFRHPATEVFYPDSGSSVRSGYRLCADDANEEDRKCSLGTLATSVVDHLLYMGSCSICECDPNDKILWPLFQLSWSGVWYITREYLGAFLPW